MTSYKTFIIAEVGSNHDTLLYRAFDLIYRAKESGADAVKFQLFRAKELCESRNAPEAYPVYKANEMPDSWLPQLQDYSNKVGIEFMCTAYNRWGLETVDPFVRKHKVASFEAQDHQFLSQVRQYNKPTILSTGMMTLDQVRKSIEVFGTESLWGLLHCTSSYPARVSEANLTVIETFTKDGWGGVCRLGLSDHTTSITCPVAAVALGATVIEKHFTDDRHRVGPDHAHSIEPSQFSQMVGMIRQVEQALGTGIKRPQPGEQANLKYIVSKQEEGYASSPAVA